MGSPHLIPHPLVRHQIALHIIPHRLLQRLDVRCESGPAQLGDVSTGMVLILRLQVLGHVDKLDVGLLAQGGEVGGGEFDPDVGLAGAEIEEAALGMRGLSARGAVTERPREISSESRGSKTMPFLATESFTTSRRMP